MQIILNGEAKNIGTARTVEQLVAVLKLDTRKVAIEHNLEIVPRSAYENAALKEGDAIEIVQFIGGG